MSDAISTPNETIKEETRAAAAAVLACVQRLNDGNVPVVYKTSMVPTELSGGFQSSTDVLHSAPHAVGGVHPRELEELEPTFARLSTQLLALPGFCRWIEKHISGGDLEHRAQFGAGMVVRTLAVKSCAELAYEIEPARWEKAWDDAWPFLSRGVVEMRTIAPIAGLTLQEKIDLHGVEIRPMTLDERSALSLGRHSGPGAMFIDTCIEVRGHVPFDDRNENARQMLVLDVVTACQLWTAKRAIPYIVQHHAEWPTGGIQGTLATEDFILGMPLERVDEFQRFWDETRAAIAQPAGALRVALSRFKIMNHQPRATDRMLDQMILFEALFLGDEKQELSYRLRMRAAHFLGDTLSERQQIEKTVKLAYGVRSKIAHGAELDEKDAAVQSEMDDLTCKLLRRFLVEASSRRVPKVEKLIIEEMDRRLLERAGS